jgi:hypothetical protein
MRNTWDRVPTITVRITRETFAEEFEKAAPKRMVKAHETAVTFDTLKARYVAELDLDIRSTESHIAMQERRFAAWVKTLDWDGAKYVPYVPVAAEEITLPVEDDFHY